MAAVPQVPTVASPFTDDTTPLMRSLLVTGWWIFTLVASTEASTDGPEASAASPTHRLAKVAPETCGSLKVVSARTMTELTTWLPLTSVDTSKVPGAPAVPQVPLSDTPLTESAWCRRQRVAFGILIETASAADPRSPRLDADHRRDVADAHVGVAGRRHPVLDEGRRARHVHRVHRGGRQGEVPGGAGGPAGARRRDTVDRGDHAGDRRGPSLGVGDRDPCRHRQRGDGQCHRAHHSSCLPHGFLLVSYRPSPRDVRVTTVAVRPVRTGRTHPPRDQERGGDPDRYRDGAADASGPDAPVGGVPGRGRRRRCGRADVGGSALDGVGGHLDTASRAPDVELLPTTDDVAPTQTSANDVTPDLPRRGSCRPRPPSCRRWHPACRSR